MKNTCKKTHPWIRRNRELRETKIAIKQDPDYMLIITEGSFSFGITKRRD